MIFNSTINAKAWEIRRATAKRCNCSASDVQWGKCLELARESDTRFLDCICRKHTGYNSFKHLIKSGKKGVVILRLNTGKSSLLILANAFDIVMRLSGKTCRVNRTINRKRNK